MNEIKKKNYSICLINIYFGKLPNYFQLWLNSCKYNETINFIIFTDDDTKYDYPKNVKVVYTTLSKIKDRIQKKFEFKISLDYAYKLCDYKPTYGYIFQEELKEYDFWGYCDLDVIFGNLRKYLDINILTKYDKIYTVGHFTIYKNKDEINDNFREVVNEKTGQPLYKEVFSNNNSFYFDEWAGILNLYKGKKYKMYSNPNVIADIAIQYNNFILNREKKNGKYIFHWCIDGDNSKLYGIYRKNKKILTKEFMYIHLQKRNMEFDINNFEQFFIVPNKFLAGENQKLDDIVKGYCGKFNYYRKEYIILRIKRLYQKILKKGKKNI